MLRLHLMRHGQTDCSARGVFCGRCDAPLNARGHAMAEALARAYAPRPWAALVASPQARAQQTLAPLAAARGQPLVTVPLLAELDYGSWDGQTGEALAASPEGAQYAAWQANPASLGPPGGETGEAVAARGRAALASLQAAYPTGDVLVVSHKSTLRVLLCTLLEVPLRHFRVRFACGLGAVHVVDLTRRGPLLRSLGDLSYLPEALRDLPGS
jgi:broad specificity phosphatase PhoE